MIEQVRQCHLLVSEYRHMRRLCKVTDEKETTTIEDLRNQLTVELEKSAKAEVQLVDATAEFENARSGSVDELLKAAKQLEATKRSVATNVKSTKVAEYAIEHFAVVGIYASVKADVQKIASKFDITGLLSHDVDTLAITIKFDADGLGDIIVNTLGKRTPVRGTSTGVRRARNVYVKDGQRLSSRELVEQFGTDVLSDETTAKVLDQPGRYGLTHAADKVAEKLGYVKEENGNGESA